jgi:hypothetical protein
VRLHRREFLAGLTGSVAAVSLRASAAPQAPQQAGKPQEYGATAVALKSCWLDVCAPFVAEDSKLGLSTEILLTATCFPGEDGFRNSDYGTEYTVELFDARGREVSLGSSARMTIPAMRPRVLRIGELIGRKNFWGGARIRLAPSGPKQVTHAGDLFSAGFVRWNLPANFDNVHAHPAAPAQMTGKFFYSMPFPALDEYHCAFAIFNPGEEESFGVIKLFEPMGRVAVERPYRLRPHAAQVFTLADMKPADSPAEALKIAPAPDSLHRRGGVVMMANESDAVPYAYTFMKGRSGGSFTVEHPLHFADRPVKEGRINPYGANRSFPAEAFLYTPLLFAGCKIGGLSLESRIYLSASRWREEKLWLMPFVTDSRGMINWVSNRDEALAQRVEPSSAAELGLLRLGEFCSCRLDARRLPLEANFSGGFGVATIPPTSHSLMKAEVRAPEWGRVAFTHFRPGGHFHKRYRTADQRGNLATDYVVSGCQVRGSASARKLDCLLCVMNIEFEDERTGWPRVQLFGPSGLLAEKSLGEFPPLACRHLLLSELFPDLQTAPGQPLTLRMLDASAMTVVSVLHLDYEKRDLALEHGSDRHSTYGDFKC